MDCPACARTLEQQAVGDITVDVCEGGCGGVFFDNFELDKVDERHETAGEVLLDVRRDPDVVIDPGKRRSCPRCGDVIMMRHYFSVQRTVEVDECPQCGGVFLDAGELAAIRAQFATEGERKQAAEEQIKDLFGKQLATMERRSQQDLERAQRFARALRFLLPSDWIPGKRDWGAF